MRVLIIILILILVVPSVAIAQTKWLEDSSELKLRAELAIDLFEQAGDLGTKTLVDFQFPERSFQKDILGFRFDPQKDPNAYLTYEVNQDDLNGTEIGVSLNYSGNFLITYHFAIDLKKK